MYGLRTVQVCAEAMKVLSNQTPIVLKNVYIFHSAPQDVNLIY